MQKLLIVFFLLFSLNAKNIDQLVYKGKKIAKVFCQSSKLPNNTNASLEELQKAIIQNKACSKLSPKRLEALTYYLKYKKESQEELKVPQNAKCPVCGMFISKYPKWAALIVVNNKDYYFDGVKDMMKFYFFDANFPYDRSKIQKMKVTNYYTLKAIDAKSAFYVYDSKQYGPMGRELIAFSSKSEALNFIKDHGGRLMRFNEITPKLVMALDGIDMP